MEAEAADAEEAADAAEAEADAVASAARAAAVVDGGEPGGVDVDEPVDLEAEFDDLCEKLDRLRSRCSRRTRAAGA